MPDLHSLLKATAERHSHLCPRQVLGVRAGLVGISTLGIEVPRGDKRLLVILETDGCFADGIEVVTGTSIGRRTLRIEDAGKIAATFIDTRTKNAVRVAPFPDIRRQAWRYAENEKRRYFVQLKAYQVMPPDEIFRIQAVELHPPIEAIISRAGIRTKCNHCGEEIINQREIVQEGMILCRSCAGFTYYTCKGEIDPAITAHPPVVTPKQD